MSNTKTNNTYCSECYKTLPKDTKVLKLSIFSDAKCCKCGDKAMYILDMPSNSSS